MTDAAPAAPSPSVRLRATLAVAAGLLSGFRAWLWIAGEGKSRDIDQLWFAAHALFAGRNPYAEIGPGLPFDWPAPLYYPLNAALTIAPLSLLDRRTAGVLFAAIASMAFVWATTRRHIAPAVVITSASAAFAAETVQWSPLLGAAVSIPWLGFFLSAKPTIGFAMWVARPTRWAIVGAVVLAAIAWMLLPAWPAEWLAALRHTSIATAGGTPYLSPIRTLGGCSAALCLTRWRRPEARLVLALACVPQTPLLYETVPLFLVPVTIAEGGILWLGSWLVALWLSLSGPFASELARFTASARDIGWCMYLPCAVMILRRPNVGPIPDRVEGWLAGSGLPSWVKGRAN